MRYDRIEGAELDRPCRAYTAITGDPAKTRGKKQLLAACFRVHGPDTLAYIEYMYQESGTVTNLLGVLRSADPPPAGEPVAHPAPDASNPVAPPASTPVPRASTAVTVRRPFDVATWDGCRCPVETLLPDLIYCDAHRPPFGTGDARHDRRTSNPRAARFFLLQPDHTQVAAGHVLGGAA